MANKEIVNRMIDIVYMMMPESFEEHLGIYDLKKSLYDWEGLLPENMPLMPSNFSCWAALNLGDKKLYPRILGATVAFNYHFLHPLERLFDIKEDEVNSKSDLYVYDFDQTMAECCFILPYSKSETDEFVLEELDRVSFEMQQSCVNMGLEILDGYKNCASPLNNMENMISFYDSIINLSQYCWQMSINEDTKKSISQEVIELDCTFKAKFNKPLHRKLIDYVRRRRE